MQSPMRLFLDLDGVLVDFDEGVVRRTGKAPADLGDRVMWPILAKTPDFYDKLGWMADGRDLWAFCRAFRPTILTGLPIGKWAEPQKRSWCARELGPEVPVITCFSREKAAKAAETLAPGQTMVLVDDRLKLQSAWEDAGGRFVLHTSAATSIAALRDLGFA